MEMEIVKRAFRSLSALVLFAAFAAGSRADLLTNGDFEAAPILGAGQTGVPIGGNKYILTDTSQPLYNESISGITGWTYALPFFDGRHSDHGLARRNAEFGRPAEGQSLFINNWNRMVSQSVSVAFRAGDTIMASVDFGTLGSNTDAGRAGRFYLVAGEADPTNQDQLSSRSIILGELSVANPTWSGFTPDVIVGNGVYTRLNLSYLVRTADLALGLPLTIAFRTVTGSVGPTYWDNASLSIRTVPEPASFTLMAMAAVAFAVGLLARTRMARRPFGGVGEGIESET
ncbi:MAG: hypothetical protein U0800_25665 [Isosphaeraceae bacterium]